MVKFVNHVQPVGGDQPPQLIENRGPGKPPAANGRGQEVYNAAKDGSNDKMSTLLGDGGCEVNWRDTSTGATPAYIAAANGHDECLRLLLSHGALVDAQTNFGRTGLIAAASGGHAGCVSQLLAAGADPSLRGSDNRTAEGVAMAAGGKGVANTYDCVRLLKQAAEAAKSADVVS